MSEPEINLSKEIEEANARLPVVIDREMPLDITIRSMALSIAQRHCGDITVKEGNLYQQLKMDNKLAGPLTVEHVIHTALIFEAYMWGKWSQDIAGKAMDQTLEELNAAIKRGEMDKHIDLEGIEGEPPIRPHSGEGP